MSKASEKKTKGKKSADKNKEYAPGVYGLKLNSKKKGSTYVLNDKPLSSIGDDGLLVTLSRSIYNGGKGKKKYSLKSFYNEYKDKIDNGEFQLSGTKEVNGARVIFINPDKKAGVRHKYVTGTIQGLSSIAGLNIPAGISKYDYIQNNSISPFTFDVEDKRVTASLNPDFFVPKDDSVTYNPSFEESKLGKIIRGVDKEGGEIKVRQLPQKEEKEKIVLEKRSKGEGKEEYSKKSFKTIVKKLDKPVRAEQLAQLVGRHADLKTISSMYIVGNKDKPRKRLYPTRIQRAEKREENKKKKAGSKSEGSDLGEESVENIDIDINIEESGGENPNVGGENPNVEEENVGDADDLN